MDAIAFSSRKRTYDIFHASSLLTQPDHAQAQRLRVAVKVVTDYRAQAVPEAPNRGSEAAASQRATISSKGNAAPLLLLTDTSNDSTVHRSAERATSGAMSQSSVVATPQSTALALTGGAAAVHDVVAALSKRQQPRGVATESLSELKRAEELTERVQAQSRAVAARRAPPKVPEPAWHAPWRLMRVISGHLGWVRAVAVEPGNEWFVTGSADRTIKFWDLASGSLKLTLTGHVSTVRALAVSARHPYLFSAGEDKQVKCWDLEQNKVIRQYHGHLSGVFAMALHPTLDILVTGGRDAVARVWDMRTKAAVHTLSGHEGAVSSLLTNAVDPQIVSGGMDGSVRLWDLTAGKARAVLTHHKKAVRSLAAHAREFAFVSAGADNLKKWALPDGDLVSNFSGHNSIVNTLALSADGEFV